MRKRTPQFRHSTMPYLMRWLALGLVLLMTTTIHPDDSPQLAYLHPLSDMTHCDRLILSDLDGNIQQTFDLPLTNGCTWPLWSPDGSYLAVWYPGMTLVNFSTRAVQVLNDVHAGWMVDTALWSLDGDYLAWHEHNGATDQRWQLWRLADGSQTTVSTLSEAHIAPDSIGIIQIHDNAFSLEQSGQVAQSIALPESTPCTALVRLQVDQPQCVTDDSILLIHADGSSTVFPYNAHRQITITASVWSPDSTRIAYEAFDESTRSRWIEVAVNDGSAPRQLTYPGGDSYDVLPQWSPDSRAIAFQRHSGYKGLEARIMIINEDGSGLHLIGDGVYPAWRPAGRSRTNSSGGIS